jgi:hypothetical protein
MNNVFGNDTASSSIPRPACLGNRRWPLGFIVAVSVSLVAMAVPLGAKTPLYSDALHAVEVVANGQPLCNSVAQLLSKLAHLIHDVVGYGLADIA